MSPDSRFLAHAYGLNWSSDIPLEQFASAVAASPTDVEVNDVPALTPRAPTARVRAGAVFADGTRFPWYRQACFDMFDGRRIDVLRGPAWHRTLPHAFYGTVVAHLLAWRGLIPMHGCAVEIGGRALLILGEAGAGKSSLTAGLIAAGARLVSDDLSVLAYDPTSAARAIVFPGRTTIRLDPVVADWLDGDRLNISARDTRGKVVLRPASRSSGGGLPLAGVIALGLDPSIQSPLVRARLLSQHVFRPVWLAALPGHAARQRALLTLAATVPVRGFPAIMGGGSAAHAARAHAVLALMRDL